LAAGEQRCVESCRGYLSGNLSLQFVDEADLARQDSPARLFEVEPCRAIDFGEGSHAPRLRRPFDLEVIARYDGRIAIALECPGGDEFSAALPDRTERDERLLRRQPRFLAELALGSGQRAFGFGVFPLRNRPGTEVLVLPIGAPG
jgi:hypothetical protein